MAQINLRNFPDDLHRELKVAAAKSDTHMREFIIAALTAAIAKPVRKAR
jgi:plasmid stability protein